MDLVTIAKGSKNVRHQRREMAINAVLSPDKETPRQHYAVTRTRANDLGRQAATDIAMGDPRGHATHRAISGQMAGNRAKRILPLAARLPNQPPPKKTRRAKIKATLVKLR